MEEHERTAGESNENLPTACPNAAYGTAEDRAVRGQMLGNGGITANERQLLEEGYVYDNEDLVTAQLNAAYSTGRAGQLEIAPYAVGHHMCPCAFYSAYGERGGEGGNQTCATY